MDSIERIDFDQFIQLDPRWVNVYGFGMKVAVVGSSRFFIITVCSNKNIHLRSHIHLSGAKRHAKVNFMHDTSMPFTCGTCVMSRLTLRI